MYHWHTIDNNQLHRLDATSAKGELLKSGGPEGMDSIDFKVGKKWIWLGFFETIPALTGVFLTEYADSFLFPLDYVAMGLLISLIMAFFLNSKAPSPPITFTVPGK